MRLKLRDISYIAAAVAILAASAWVSIPSSPPFTLQILAVCIIGGLFGAKKAVLSVLLYIAVGLVGMPVFSDLGAERRLLRAKRADTLSDLPSPPSYRDFFRARAADIWHWVCFSDLLPAMYSERSGM